MSLPDGKEGEKVTTPDQATKEIRIQLQTLTLSEKALRTESVLRDLITVKTEIEVLDIALDGDEPWLMEWLSKAHLKGAMLNQGARTSYQKERAEGSRFPFDAEGRAYLIERFNAWSQKTASQLVGYEHSDRTADVVAPWISELDAFKANPTSTY